MYACILFEGALDQGLMPVDVASGEFEASAGCGGDGRDVTLYSRRQARMPMAAKFAGHIHPSRNEYVPGWYAIRGNHRRIGAWDHYMKITERGEHGSSKAQAKAKADE